MDTTTTAPQSLSNDLQARLEALLKEIEQETETFSTTFKQGVDSVRGDIGASNADVDQLEKDIAPQIAELSSDPLDL